MQKKLFEINCALVFDCDVNLLLRVMFWCLVFVCVWSVDVVVMVLCVLCVMCEFVGMLKVLMCVIMVV